VHPAAVPAFDHWRLGSRRGLLRSLVGGARELSAIPRIDSPVDILKGAGRTPFPGQGLDIVFESPCVDIRGTGVSRRLWLALICLVSLGVLLALRSKIGAGPIDGETAAPILSSDPPIADRPPLAKSDRLPSPYFDKTPVKPAGTIQILGAVPNPPITPQANKPGDLPSQATGEANDVTTWHWHAGSKITKRTTVAPRDSRKAD
jgi:hypothetical protein